MLSMTASETVAIDLETTNIEDTIPSADTIPTEDKMLEDFKKNGFELICSGIEKPPSETKTRSRVEAGKLVRVFWLPENFVCRASFSHDKFTIQSIRLLPLVRLVPRDHETVCEVSGRTGLNDVQASQVDGPFSVAMAAEQKREVTVWKKDLEGKQILFGHQLPVKAVSWSPCGKMLASVAGKELVSDKNEGSLTDMAVSCFNARIKPYLSDLLPFNLEQQKSHEIGEVIVWDLELEQPKFSTSILYSQVRSFLSRDDEILQSLCWSPCGLYLACGTYSSVLLFDAATGKLLNHEKIETGPRPFLTWGKSQIGDDLGYLACGWTLADKLELSDSLVKDGALKIWKMSRHKFSNRLQASDCPMEEDPDRSCKCLDWSRSSYSELILASITTTHNKFWSIRLWHRSAGGTWQPRPVAKISHTISPVWLAFQRDARLEGSKVSPRAGERRVGKISLDRGDSTVDIVYEKVENGSKVEQTDNRVRTDSLHIPAIPEGNGPTLAVSTLKNVYRFRQRIKENKDC